MGPDGGVVVDGTVIDGTVDAVAGRESADLAALQSDLAGRDGDEPGVDSQADVPLLPPVDAVPAPDAPLDGQASVDVPAATIAVDGATGPSACTGNVAAPTIAITSPIAGAALQAGPVVVVGTVQAARTNYGVAVNGVAAATAGGRFVATHVVLRAGEATLAAVATDDCGRTARAEIAVVVHEGVDGGAPELEVATDRSIGVAPLDVRFSSSLRFEKGSRSVAWDFDGNGSVDKTVNAGAEPVTFRYEKPGLYLATGSSTSANGALQSAAVLVEVLSSNAIDALSRDLWDRFAQAALAGNTSEALGFVLSGERPGCSALFARLGAALPLLFSGAETWKDVTFLAGGVAQYVVVVDHGNGVRIGYPRWFARDTDGLWRMGSF